MMYNEANMVILILSHANASFTLLKFGQVSICQKRKLQITIFLVYKASGAQSTKKQIW